MPGFWGAVDTNKLERTGPIGDSVCGTNGESTDLNALVAAGRSRIILAPGAILTANLTITSAGFLWSPFHPRNLNLGAFTLTINAGFFHLEGFSIQGASGAGVVVLDVNNVSIVRVGALNCGSHGIHMQSTFDNHEIRACFATGNAGDGIRLDAGSNYCRLIGNLSTGNTGYGINDLSNSGIVVANRIDGNTAGALNGTPAIDVGNKKT